MEERHERKLDDGGDLAKTDAPQTPSLDEHTRSQDLQGHNPACSNSIGDVQYIDHERKIMKRLDNSLQELFKNWTVRVEKRFIELENNVIKIQRQMQFIQQQLNVPQHLKRHESLISLQPEPAEEGCCEDCDNSSCYSSESDDSYSAYLQRMQKYQENFKFGARHLSLKPSRVMRQKRVYSRNSLSLPSNTIIL